MRTMNQPLATSFRCARRTLPWFIELIRASLEEQPAGVSSDKGCHAERDDELKRLRRELADAREENEILKKAAAYFARNQR